MENPTDFFQGKDIHDTFSSVTPRITQNAKQSISVGIDWKENLLKKASKLKLYKKLIQHNLNDPLPLPDKYAKTIFSNIFYWIDDIEQLFRESNRILDDKGKLILFLPDINFKKNLLINRFSKKYDWVKFLDHDIAKNIGKHCYDYSKWKKIFSSNNFVIKNHSSYLSDSFVKFWTIGMRPYSPYFIEMANSLEPKIRKKIKLKLIKEIALIADSYVKYEISSKSKNNCFHFFELEKQ
jgi:SAM-dependent methyltransferase